MKNKSTAIVLAIFFSYWSWLYTYKKNSTKFWVCFGLNIIAIIIIFIAGLVFVKITTEGHPEFIEYLIKLETFFQSNSAGISELSYRTFSIILLTLGIAGILETGIWIWSLIYNATKDKDFYTDYPKTR